MLWLILVLVAFGLGFQIGSSGIKADNNNLVTEIEAPEIVPESVTLPVDWGSIGKKMVDFGVIDMNSLSGLYEKRGGLSETSANLLSSVDNDEIVMIRDNSQELLNILWAFGLSNKSRILEEGEMINPQYGGAGRFASTGGWSLSEGDAMKHYSAHPFIKLSVDEEELVKEVADNIYRPCCGNPTSFPDCNHGMAMLGLLELMAGNGAMESEMYSVALRVNSLWFPGTYETIAKYFAKQGVSWEDMTPKEILSARYSSAAGYRNVLQAVESSGETGASCGV